jgi:hypothetical protein
LANVRLVEPRGSTSCEARRDRGEVPKCP